jgi:hypothetical protein
MQFFGMQVNNCFSKKGIRPSEPLSGIRCRINHAESLM